MKTILYFYILGISNLIIFETKALGTNILQLKNIDSKIICRFLDVHIIKYYASSGIIKYFKKVP